MLLALRFSSISLVLCICVALVDAVVIDSLKYWETITVSSIQRRIVKRDISNSNPSEQLIEFDSFGRHFSLLLRKDFSVLAPGFKIMVFEADDQSHEEHLDLNLYRGIVEGDSGSLISAYLKDNLVLSASIRTGAETYVVEPAANLIPNSTDDSMIIYRESDLKWNNDSRCGYVNDDEDTISLDHLAKAKISQSIRSKRGNCSPTRNTCHLYLVADPRFVENIGQNNTKETAGYMLSVVDRIDLMYREHIFKGCDKGFGFEVKRINIFLKPTKTYPYTMNKDFVYSDFLQTFNKDVELSSVCLGHVFTFQQFYDEGYILGLAYTASPDLYKRGGICSTSPFSRNTGWTSYVGRYKLSALQATLVTAHEFGHNWGSPHDSDKNAECAPSAAAGGRYIMYPMSVSGRDHNNMFFSPCSLHSMGSVLQAKSSCFAVKKEAFCGNYRIDAGEECDTGFNVAADGDKCCDSNCKLRPGAHCSDFNKKCCSNCKVISKSAKFVCFNSSDDVCALDSECDGVNFDCPQPEHKPDRSPCFNKGECRKGICIALCGVHGYEKCTCDDVENSCKRCCIKDGRCSPLLLNGAYDNMPEGMPCLVGECDEKGACQRTIRNPLARLWEMLDLSSPGAFVRFMQNNVVLTIVVLSLLLWIPASCLVCYLDKKAKNERDQMISDVLDEMLNEEETGFIGSAVTPSSPLPKTRLAQQREKQRESIRLTVRRMTVMMDSSLQSSVPQFD